MGVGQEKAGALGPDLVDVLTATLTKIRDQKGRMMVTTQVEGQKPGIQEVSRWPQRQSPDKATCSQRALGLTQPRHHIIVHFPLCKTSRTGSSPEAGVGERGRGWRGLLNARRVSSMCVMTAARLCEHTQPPTVTQCVGWHMKHFSTKLG